MVRKVRPAVFLFFLLGAVAFCFFYLKYVPLIRPFQFILAPLLGAVFVLVLIRVEWGLLFFVFVFPLINNLPYFFGIYGSTPHAPTALVLFLALALGWLLRGALSESKLTLNTPLSKPLFLFSLLVLISGVITFFRYADFFPFLSDGIYELSANVNNVTAGGAIMSDLFTLLTYLTGFLFFIILFNTVSSWKSALRILTALSFSTLLSLLFALIQKFHSPSLGNTPYFVTFQKLNSTFKDPNSFGAYLAAFIVLALGVSFSVQRRARWFVFGLIVLSLYVFPITGSRSGFLALAISFPVFLILVFFKSKSSPKKRMLASLALIMIVVLAFVFLFVFSRQSILYKNLDWSKDFLTKKINTYELFSRRTHLWEAAGTMIRDYPLTGVGLGAFIVEAPNYFKVLGMVNEQADSALNYFFQVGSELGLVGLFAAAWLFFEVAKRARRAWKEIPETDSLSFVLIGASAGLISFFVNFFLHTYIGSYEIQYTIWLLVAVIFLLPRFKQEPEVQKKLDRRFKTGALALALLFGAVQLWNSTHALSLPSRAEEFGLKQEFGFYQREKTDDGKEFRWTKRAAGVTIKIENPTLEVPLLASHPDIQKKPVTVRFYLIKDLFKEKKYLGEVILKESVWKTYQFPAPEDVGREALLLVKVSRTWNPRKTLQIPDPRNLGVALGKVSFR